MISLNYDKAIHYDMYSVYIKDKDGHDYLFDQFINGKVKARKWDSDNSIFQVESILLPENLTVNSFSGIYYYHAHELNFNSLEELSWGREFIFRVKSNYSNWSFSREKYLYRKQKQEITDVMTVLSSVISIFRNQKDDSPFSEFLIMNDIAGKLWIYHDDHQRMRKELRLCLDSLVEHGDVIKKENLYKPSGKALNTISEYNRAEQRYKESIRSQNKMFWATLFSAIAAIGSAVAAFKGLK